MNIERSRRPAPTDAAARQGPSRSVAAVLLDAIVSFRLLSDDFADANCDAPLSTCLSTTPWSAWAASSEVLVQCERQQAATAWSADGVSAQVMGPW